MEVKVAPAKRRGWRLLFGAGRSCGFAALTTRSKDWRISNFSRGKQEFQLDCRTEMIVLN